MTPTKSEPYRLYGEHLRASALEVQTITMRMCSIGAISGCIVVPPFIFSTRTMPTSHDWYHLVFSHKGLKKGISTFGRLTQAAVLCIMFLLLPTLAMAGQSATSGATMISTAPAPPVAVCTGCHGDRGAGSEAVGAPRLAGMNPDYLAHALSMFKDGTRASVVMQPVAERLSHDEMRALATYFSAQHPPLAHALHAPSADMILAGKRLAESGGENGVPSCFSCHGPSGQGDGARIPAIAGQPKAFSIARIHEFQARARAAPPKPGSMTEVASRMDDAQIEASAAYFSVTKP
jgi:cytochrome c553